MKEIIIRLDYLHGPLWKNSLDSEGNMITGVPVIDNDAAIQTLNDKAEELYSSLYRFDEGNEACSFDENAFTFVKPQLLSLIETIIARLELLNDGSYTIKDEETEKLRNLKVS